MPSTGLSRRYETTSLALSYALYELAKRPDLQRRVAEEADALVGTTSAAPPKTINPKEVVALAGTVPAAVAAPSAHREGAPGSVEPSVRSGQEPAGKGAGSGASRTSTAPSSGCGGGGGGALEYSDLSRLPYTEAVLLEAMRM